MLRKDAPFFGFAEDGSPVGSEDSFIGEAIWIVHQQESKASGLPGNLQSSSNPPMAQLLPRR
jgi:hypothetical protein